jgi:TPR repeat protein
MDANKHNFIKLGCEQLSILIARHRYGVGQALSYDDTYQEELEGYVILLNKLSDNENEGYIGQRIYAKIELAELYEEGKGVEKDLNRARELYEEADKLVSELVVEDKNGIFREKEGLVRDVCDGYDYEYLKARVLLGKARANMRDGFKKEALKNAKGAYKTNTLNAYAVADLYKNFSEKELNSIGKKRVDVETLYKKSFEYLTELFSNIENTEVKDLTPRFIRNLDILINHHSNGLGTKVNEKEAKRLRLIKNKLILQSVKDAYGIKPPQRKPLVNIPHGEIDGLNIKELSFFASSCRYGMGNQKEDFKKDFELLRIISDTPKGEDKKDRHIRYRIYAKLELAKYYEGGKGIAKDLDEAKKLYEEVIKLSKEIINERLSEHNTYYEYSESRALLGIARVHAINGDIERGLEVSKVALEKHDTPTARCQVADLLRLRSGFGAPIDKEDWDESEKLYKESIELLTTRINKLLNSAPNIENIKVEDIQPLLIQELDLLIELYTKGLGTEVNMKKANEFRLIRNRIVVQSIKNSPIKQPSQFPRLNRTPAVGLRQLEVDDIPQPISPRVNIANEPAAQPAQLNPQQPEFGPPDDIFLRGQRINIQQVPQINVQPKQDDPVNAKIIRFVFKRNSNNISDDYFKLAKNYEKTNVALAIYCYEKAVSFAQFSNQQEENKQNKLSGEQKIHDINNKIKKLSTDSRLQKGHVNGAIINEVTNAIKLYEEVNEANDSLERAEEELRRREATKKTFEETNANKSPIRATKEEKDRKNDIDSGIARAKEDVRVAKDRLSELKELQEGKVTSPDIKDLEEKIHKQQSEIFDSYLEFEEEQLSRGLSPSDIKELQRKFKPSAQLGEIIPSTDLKDSSLETVQSLRERKEQLQKQQKQSVSHHLR